MTPPGDIPNPGIELASPEVPALQADSLWLSSDCWSPLLQTCIQPDSLSCLLKAVFSGLLRYCLLGSKSLTLLPNKTIYL